MLRERLTMADSPLPRMSFTALMLSALLISVSRLSAAESIVDRVKTDAPAQWRAYREAASRLQGSCKTTETNVTTGATPNVVEYSIKQCAPCALYRMNVSSGGGQASATVRSRANHYAFRLNRSDAEAPWIVTEFVPATAVDNVDTASAMALAVACGGLYVLNESLPDMFAAPGFALRDASVQDAGGRQLIRVVFDYGPQDKYANPLRGGWIDLDPGRYWMISRYQIKAEYQDGEGTIENKLDFKNAAGQFPVLQHYVRRQKGTSNDGKVYEIEYVGDYDLRIQDTVPASEFTLSAFGLPEPSVASDVASRWRRWGLWGGAAALVVAAILARLARRATRASRSPA